LLYGTDDYVKAPHIVHSGANFTVCSARTLGLVAIHIAVPSIYAFDSLCSYEYWTCILLGQNVIFLTELCQASTAGTCSRMLAYEGIATVRKTLMLALKQESH
jgi:hypothetical protein